MIGRTRWQFQSVDSTQNVAFQLAVLGAESGTVVRAGYQSAGRGRLGRAWESPANSALTFSIILRPSVDPHELGTLAIRIADVLCVALNEMGVRDISLKWPNDVLISGSKVSGILVQTRMMPELVAVIGIGINISASPPGATHVNEAISCDIEAEQVLDAVLAGLDRMWSSWQPELTENQVDDLEKKLWLRDEPVVLRDADRDITGTIDGLAPDGGLRLISNGKQQVVRVGEITRGPRPMDLH